MKTLRLVVLSLLHRRLTTALTIASIAISIALLVGVERIRSGARDSFSGTISQTDLVVGARGGSIQLLLYSVFRMGTATGNLSYDTYQHFKSHPAVSWTIPYSLGDSHRGFRVVGTNLDFYTHYRFRREGRIEFASGGPAKNVFDVAIGFDVAEALGYVPGDDIVLAHGVSDGPAIQSHDDKPFKVVGILKKTNTPIDRSLYVTLEGIEAIHVDWQDGAAPAEADQVKVDELTQAMLAPKQLTAFLLRAKNRFEILKLQREINVYPQEPLTAIIPGVALSELWEGLSYAEDGLRVISAFVVLVGLLGMLISIYNSLNERRREMAILRSLGAKPSMIAMLLVFEALALTTLGVISGVFFMYAILFVAQPLIEQQFGLFVPIAPLSLPEWLYIGFILVAAIFMGILPAVRAYRNTLQDGLTIRV